MYLEPDNYQKIKIPISGIVRKNKKEKRVTLQKTFSLDDHLSQASRETFSLFNTLREKITSLDENIIEAPKAKYIAYKTSTNFVDVVIMRSSLKIFLNIKSGRLNDPSGLARDLTKPKPIGHWGNGDYEVKLEKESDLEKVFNLIKQSYNFNK